MDKDSFLERLNGIQNMDSKVELLEDEEEPVCIIDPETRRIQLVNKDLLLGVESDEKATKIRFQSPKIVGNDIDLTKLVIRINYRDADGNIGQNLAENITDNGDTVTFDWIPSRSATKHKGNISFIVCAVDTADGTVKNEWNTTLASATVLEGIEPEDVEIPEDDADIISQLIQQINVAKDKTEADSQSAKESAEQAKLSAEAAKNSESATSSDAASAKDYKGATENGIPVGAYFFTYAKTEEAQNEEIEMMLKAFEGKTFQYPIALDIEDSKPASIGKAALTALVKRGLDIIDQKGYMPILYTYTNYKQNYLDMSKLSAYDLWLADTRSSYDGRGKSAIWQYGQEKIDGVNGDCDVNYCYKNYNCDSQTPVDPEPENPVDPPKPTDPDEPNQKAIVFKKGSWNVRSGPGTEYSSVGVITSPDPKTGKDVVIGYESVVNGWYKTIYGYIGPSAIDTNKKPQKAIVFKQGTWNVRTGPGMNYGVVGTISSPDAKTGKAVTIGYEKINNGWFKTMYGYVGPSAVASYT